MEIEVEPEGLAEEIPRKDTPYTSVINAKDWTGNEDPENPRNFSRPFRIYSTAAVAALAFTTAFAASIYSPGINGVREGFNVSEEVAILPLSLYNLGLAIGPLVGSPLSETSGRKVVLLITTPLFILFTLGAGFSPNISSLIICRFLAGVFAAPAVSTASATITDFTTGKNRAIAMAVYYSTPTFGAVLGPLVGGFVVEAKGWRWTQWTTIFCTVAFYIPILFTKETYKKTILQRRAKRLGVEGPAQIARTPMQMARHFATTLLLRPVRMLLTEPIVLLVCLYNGFMFGLMYTYIVASPWIYEHYYSFDQNAVNLSFLGLIIGAVLAPIPLIVVDQCIYQTRLKKFHQLNPPSERFPPEHRLYPAMSASFLLPAVLFTFAWTTRPSIHWICPIILQGLTMLCNMVIYAPANHYMIDTYGPLYGASAAAATMMTRYMFSAAFPLFGLQMYKTLGVGWATSILGGCALVMAPVPFLFFRGGERLRRGIKYETSV